MEERWGQWFAQYGCFVVPVFAKDVRAARITGAIVVHLAVQRAQRM